MPVVQIPGGAGMPQNANVPWRHFWLGYPPNAQQNSPGHLNRKETQTNHRNTLRDIPLYELRKHISWFRCSGKGKHLNPTARQNPTAKTLTTNTLQDFRRLYPWFRSMAGLECRGMQMCPGCASGWGIRQARNRTALASEPERNSKNSLQHIEKLYIARF